MPHGRPLTHAPHTHPRQQHDSKKTTKRREETGRPTLYRGSPPRRRRSQLRVFAVLRVSTHPQEAWRGASHAPAAAPPTRAPLLEPLGQRLLRRALARTRLSRGESEAACWEDSVSGDSARGPRAGARGYSPPGRRQGVHLNMSVALGRAVGRLAEGDAPSWRARGARASSPQLLLLFWGAAPRRARDAPFANAWIAHTYAVAPARRTPPSPPRSLAASIGRRRRAPAPPSDEDKRQTHNNPQP